MTKIIFAIFAHPDDEAFGPAGTLLWEVNAGAVLHLVSLTAGEAGMNPDNLPNLKETRLKEWRTAGDLIGAKEMHYLGFADSRLDNSDMQTAAEKIEDLVRVAISNLGDQVEIEFITNDLNGITGHIDHIVASRAACLAFYRLKDQGLPMSRIRLSCIPKEHLPTHNTNWLYMESGRPHEEIDEIISGSEYYETILKIMRAHHSQRGDGESHIANRSPEQLTTDYFIVLK